MFILHRARNSGYWSQLESSDKKVYVNEFGASEASFVVKFLGENKIGNNF